MDCSVERQAIVAQSPSFCSIVEEINIFTAFNQLRRSSQTSTRNLAVGSFELAHFHLQLIHTINSYANELIKREVFSSTQWDSFLLLKKANNRQLLIL